MQANDRLLDDLLKGRVALAWHVESREQVADQTHEYRQIVRHDLGNVEISQSPHQHLNQCNRELFRTAAESAEYRCDTILINKIYSTVIDNIMI